jgi:predicted DNA-binding protein
MKRTQIYLLESQKEQLDKLARQKGKAMAEIIREAVDMYIVKHSKASEDHILATRGLWKDRDDIDSQKYTDEIRKELDARLEDKA